MPGHDRKKNSDFFQLKSALKKNINTAGWEKAISDSSVSDSQFETRLNEISDIDPKYADILNEGSAPKTITDLQLQLNYKSNYSSIIIKLKDFRDKLQAIK